MVTGFVTKLGVTTACNAQMGSLVSLAAVAHALDYENKLDLVIDGKLLDYPLLMNDFCQRQHMISNQVVELDLLIWSCLGQAKHSIKSYALDTVASNGLTESLHTLASDFCSLMVLKWAFMWDMLGTSNKMKVRDSAHNLLLFKISLENICHIMVSQGRCLELNSEPVLQ